MKEFNETNEQFLIKDEYYLVYCPRWSPSDYDIAEWDDKCFISQANNSKDINQYVVGFMATHKLPQI